MKNILVALDLTELCERALARAIQLRDQHAATLHVVHVVDDVLSTEASERLRGERTALLRGELAKMTDHGSANETLRVVIGRPVDEIISSAVSIDADLIVLGARREGKRTSDFFVGTTAWRVLRHSKRPVLVVRDWTGGPYQRLLVGFDFSEASREALVLACKLAGGPRISAIHAFHVPFSAFLRDPEDREETRQEHVRCAREGIASVLRERERAGHVSPVSIHAAVEEGDVISVIVNEARRLTPDLLVVGTRPRAGLSYAFRSSVAEALLDNPPCDIVVTAPT